MVSPYSGQNILVALGIILPYALWGISVGIVFIHASTNNRSTWFWTLVAFIPVFGILIYFAYYFYKTDPRHGYLRRRKLDRVGEYVAKPRTRRQKEDHVLIGILSNFRDKEVERMLIDGDVENAVEKIDDRYDEAFENDDVVARDTYEFYLKSAAEYRHSFRLPRVLLDLWGIEQHPAEPPGEDVIGDDEPPAIEGGGEGEEAETAEDEIIYDPDDDRNRWLEL